MSKLLEILLAQERWKYYPKGCSESWLAVTDSITAVGKGHGDYDLLCQLNGAYTAAVKPETVGALKAVTIVGFTT